MPHHHHHHHECEECHRRFGASSDLRAHERRLGHVPDHPRVCDVCDARFPSLDGLHRHHPLPTLLPPPRDVDGAPPLHCLRSYVAMHLCLCSPLPHSEHIRTVFKVSVHQHSQTGGCPQHFLGHACFERPVNWYWHHGCSITESIARPSTFLSQASWKKELRSTQGPPMHAYGLRGGVNAAASLPFDTHDFLSTGMGTGR
jgi:hypothetical protein